MKTIIRLLFSLNILFLFSQEVIISNKIKELHSENKEFIKYSLFSENITSQKKSKFKTVSPDATILSLREFRLEQLVKEQPEQLEIEFPYNGNMITVELYKTEILTPDFSANTHNGEKINYTPGTHYRGIIKGNETSVVSFSFYKNEVIGVSSSNELGNIELGKIKNSNDYISYSDHHLKGENPFRCAADELEENKEYLAKNKSKFNNLKTDPTNNCVRVYYEIAYKPYELNDSNIEATLNWITSIHNNIATLYANDGINITLSDILIWTEPDPYTGNHTYNLQKFRSTRPSFKGDLGNLINSPLSTSTAYMNSLCSTHNYAYSGVDLFYENVPDYSWTILAMAHEMGHSLGSPHTHACAWNGNNTAIDGCGPKYSEEYKEGDCPRGPIPTNKGTIMSYCHLLANIGVGIDLNNGFGPQPAELIRNTVESKSCLGSDCTNEFYCKKTIDDIFINNIKKTSAIVDIKDNFSSRWKYRLYQYPTAQNLAFINSDKKTIHLDNLQPNSYYVIEIGNSCGDKLISETKKLMFLTDGDYCKGDKFIAPKKEPNLDFVKTFYPNNPDDKLSLTFNNSYFLNTNHLYIYNGETTSHPLFYDGILTQNYFIKNKHYKSTASSGAITVKFENNGSIFKGQYFFSWDATVSCSKLNVEDISIENNSLSITPNPVKDILNLRLNEGINSVHLYDLSGKLILTKYYNNATSLHLNLSHLTPANYILVVKNKNDKSISAKIIKN